MLFRSLGKSAFEGCSLLRTVVIGNGLTDIEEETFIHCDLLTQISFGENVTSIGSWAFSYCPSLEFTALPDSVRTIGRSAFEYCYSLKSIELGAAASIGEYAFSDCIRLSDVFFKGSEAAWREIKIAGHNDELTSAKLHIITSIKCDADGDGIVGVKDILTVRQHTVLITELRGQLYKNADVYGDGDVNMKDAFEIIKRIAA
ncbi:MAG: leucine-rich repeat protein [Clostridia bacterium]|nr:leucine-rich repeat protein [Clostridia bacterium]